MQISLHGRKNSDFAARLWEAYYFKRIKNFVGKAFSFVTKVPGTTTPSQSCRALELALDYQKHWCVGIKNTLLQEVLAHTALPEINTVCQASSTAPKHTLLCVNAVFN